MPGFSESLVYDSMCSFGPPAPQQAQKQRFHPLSRQPKLPPPLDGLYFSCVFCAHSQGRPHIEGTSTRTVVKTGGLHQNSGECVEGSAECCVSGSPTLANSGQPSPNFYTPFAIAYLNNPKKNRIGMFPVINSQEIQIGKFQTGQGRREDRGGGCTGTGKRT